MQGLSLASLKKHPAVSNSIFYLLFSGKLLKFVVKFKYYNLILDLVMS